MHRVFDKKTSTVGKDVTASVCERYTEGARIALAFPGPLYIAPLARR